MGALTSVLVILALVAVVAHPLVRRYSRNAFFVLAAVLGAAFVALLVIAQPVFAGETRVEAFPWVPQLDLTFTFRLDTLSTLFALLVTGAGALVLLYCARYFDEGEAGLPRFAAVFMGFATSMLGLVLADDVYLLFIFWEGTTVFSFLLIGHVTRLRTSNAAALQALIVTTLGGLAMLVGFVLLAHAAGSSLLSEIVATPLSGPVTTTAVFLVLAGALSKSAIFPFHFWLPGAMAAPTPVSAYLHAAAMVKAGIYLIARITPGFEDVAGYQETLVILGAITMLNGGIRALKQYDIKLIVAHGTVSQLGLLVMVFGVGDPRASFAGLALLFAHALAKAPLFLAVGVIDHATGTRDLRRLSGLGRQLPWLTAITVVAAASMAGVPPLIGFVAKESAFTELLEIGASEPLALLAFWVALIGSMLTVAYMVRFLWGAFARKPGVADCGIAHRPGPISLIAPAAFVLLTVLGGFLAPAFDSLLQRTIVGSETPEHLALWHGFTPALGASVVVLLVGLALGALVSRPSFRIAVIPERFSASHAYWVVTHKVDSLAVKLTTLTQRGSLPYYLSVILIVMVLAVGGTMLTTAEWPTEFELVSSPVQIPIAVIMIVAAIFSLRARTRFQSVVLVGITGYGMAAIFAMHGAPDLALTQALVETVTLIAFVLVIRRLPQRIGSPPTTRVRWGRALIGISVGLVLGAVAVIALGSRIADPISLQLPEMAYAGGHGTNTVNVMLVDIRGWDTMGELSVILAAATGVASLVFLNTRADLRPKLSRRDARSQARTHLQHVADPSHPASRVSWLLAGRQLNPARRSIILEVVVRLMFHALIILSIYLLLTGHNTPGGGFAGGLVAGLALVARYLAGGRHELGATVPLDAGRILGAGLALAVSMAIIPMLFGQSALASAWVDVDLGPFGTLPLVTSTLFDIGVYLVVFGLILDVLRSLGAEIDEHEEAEATAFEEEEVSRS
ncbi:multisubunit sodium/proton antiporter MrpA subunit /multisubunit sodium/proton antiporter MrpB subunit [Leucobacter luti]|uniref:Na+/H+ antiporter subunit A n=1 Tax=Leucobacter luti TaxID=340320 RepID=UPI00104E97BB|nr:Na+/H+ antiporter subunit A [Leucobacter luti]MCW2287538.1 multicomponent Na+:H+ antiporter subunit A [Leucobacter luti]TCK46295.1 multisubunit sodium/proton antiporter MrpA subunit /multisubunit sodium/proton antiporter MrpB subunit [Leucobacter luti]